VADYFTGATSIKQPYPMTSVPQGRFQSAGSLEFPAYLSGNRASYEPLPSLGGIAGPSKASPVMAGSEPPSKSTGWGEQAKSFLQGLEKFGVGLGVGIAAARGMPMAGQMLSNYYEDKTGDREETGESSLEKAFRALREAGLISALKLDTGESTPIGGGLESEEPSYIRPLLS